MLERAWVQNPNFLSLYLRLPRYLGFSLKGLGLRSVAQKQELDKNNLWMEVPAYSQRCVLWVSQLICQKILSKVIFRFIYFSILKAVLLISLKGQIIKFTKFKQNIFF